MVQWNLNEVTLTTFFVWLPLNIIKGAEFGMEKVKNQFDPIDLRININCKYSHKLFFWSSVHIIILGKMSYF